MKVGDVLNRGDCNVLVIQTAQQRGDDRTTVLELMLRPADNPRGYWGLRAPIEPLESAAASYSYVNHISNLPNVEWKELPRYCRTLRQYVTLED